MMVLQEAMVGGAVEGGIIGGTGNVAVAECAGAAGRSSYQ